MIRSMWTVRIINKMIEIICLYNIIIFRIRHHLTNLEIHPFSDKAKGKDLTFNTLGPFLSIFT